MWVLAKGNHVCVMAKHNHVHLLLKGKNINWRCCIHAVSFERDCMQSVHFLWRYKCILKTDNICNRLKLTWHPRISTTNAPRVRCTSYVDMENPLPNINMWQGQNENALYKLLTLCCSTLGVPTSTLSAWHNKICAYLRGRQLLHTPTVMFVTTFPLPPSSLWTDWRLPVTTRGCESSFKKASN